MTVSPSTPTNSLLNDLKLKFEPSQTLSTKYFNSTLLKSNINNAHTSKSCNNTPSLNAETLVANGGHHATNKQSFSSSSSSSNFSLSPSSSSSWSSSNASAVTTSLFK